MLRIPKIKKEISSFLTKEDGNISKESLVQAGLIITAFTIGSIPVDAGCDKECDPADCGITAGTYDSEFTPPECQDNKVKTERHHANVMSITLSSDEATASHNHCYATCTADHSSHGSY